MMDCPRCNVKMVLIKCSYLCCPECDLIIRKPS